MAERRDSLWLYKKHRGKNERMNKENKGKGDEREKQRVRECNMVMGDNSLVVVN